MADSLTFVARKDIRKGEEVTADHSLFESEDYVSKWICKCGSKDCRKQITGRDYLLKSMREKYKGHFSPLINEKIKNQRIIHRKS